MLLAYLVAVVHASLVVLMLTGPLVALRCPRVLYAHVPVAGVILAVNLAGLDCPLTVLELELRAWAGGEVYAGGFLSHYLFEPLGIDVAGTGPRVGMYAVAILLNAVGYGLLAARALGTRRGLRSSRERAALAG